THPAGRYKLLSQLTSHKARSVVTVEIRSMIRFDHV
ncbi:MAG: hypothetical protein ACJA13_002051, partial [Paraglaciecola sp.]